MVAADSACPATGTAAHAAGEQAPPGVRRIGAATTTTASTAAGAPVAVLDTGIELANADLDFFFRAKDGIRALTVTGVQTCALPISRRARPRRWRRTAPA